jgi:cyclohexanecarboxylate-CoA ligase
VALETTLTGERTATLTRLGFWRTETLDTYLDRWATARPAAPAFGDARGSLTWGELARAVERVALGLRAHGLGPGDAISVQLPNWNEFVLVALAACRLGAVLNPIPPIYRARELGFMLGLLEARALVIPGTFRGFSHTAMAAGLRAGLPRLEHVFVARGTPAEGMQPFTTLTGTAWEAREGRGGLAGTDPNAVSEVIFTSGTTGEPKGAMHTTNTALSIIHPLIRRLGFTDRDVTLMSSTLGHQTGFLYGYCLTLILGGRTVWLDVWNAAAAAALIEAERVTFTMGATPFLRDLTDTPALDRHDVSSLRVFISAGASIPRQLVRDARRRLGCAISAGWGMTENGLVTCNGLEDPEEKVITTDGVPLPGMELRVAGDDGPVPAGVEGDLLVRGHSQFVGYYRRPAFTREAYTTDGWFRTGDRATLDGDGYLSITGRSKDLIIRGGENLSPAEIENLLYTHPGVAGVAVIAIPDARLGERACAVVIPRPGNAPTLGDLTSFLEAKGLARQKFPERLEIVAEFPMTPSGKIQKYRLREMVAAKLAAERAG